LPPNSDEDRDRLEQSCTGSGYFRGPLVQVLCNEVSATKSLVEVRVMAQKPAGKSACRSSRKPSRRGGRRWSARVTRESDALDLQHGVFTGRDPKKIAASLKRSAERSRRRKSDPYRSALSMLTFYINRAGKNLPAARRKTLERAKGELRRQFGRD
jgi:hypothetical protein